MDNWMHDVTARLKRLEMLCGGKQMAAMSAGDAVTAAGATPDGSVSVVSGADEVKPRAVVEWEALMAGAATELKSCGAKCGGKIAELSELVFECFSREGEVVRAICACESPGDDVDTWQELLKPVAELITKAADMDRGKSDPHFNHIKVVAESLSAMSWVCYTKESGMAMPAPFVKESWDGAEFYANKVIMENRGKDAAQVEWSKALKALFEALRLYVKDCHTTGPAWKAGGQKLADYVRAPKGASAASAPANGDAAAASEKAGLLSALNAGADVTKGLKKVTADMKTKNMKDRPPVVAASSQRKEPAVKASAAPAVKKDPKLELQGNTWVVEHYEKTKPIKVEGTKINQKVYIFKCQGSLIQVEGKVNAITLDSCKRSQLVFKDVVSSVEIVNCSSVEVQVTGNAPTVTIDKTDGCQLYLSREAMNADILSAKSSEV